MSELFAESSITTGHLLIGFDRVIEQAGDFQDLSIYITKIVAHLKPVENECTSIAFSKSSVEIDVGESVNLNALLTIKPDDCTQEVTWVADNTLITNNNGVVTGKAEGSTKVQARCGELSANITVIINAVEEEIGNGVAILRNGVLNENTEFRNIKIY